MNNVFARFRFFLGTQKAFLSEIFLYRSTMICLPKCENFSMPEPVERRQSHLCLTRSSQPRRLINWVVTERERIINHCSNYRNSLLFQSIHYRRPSGSRSLTCCLQVSAGYCSNFALYSLRFMALHRLPHFLSPPTFTAHTLARRLRHRGNRVVHHEIAMPNGI